MILILIKKPRSKKRKKNTHGTLPKNNWNNGKKKEKKQQITLTYVTSNKPGGNINNNFNHLWYFTKPLGRIIFHLELAFQHSYLKMNAVPWTKEVIPTHSFLLIPCIGVLTFCIYCKQLLIISRKGDHGVAKVLHSTNIYKFIMFLNRFLIHIL